MGTRVRSGDTEQVVFLVVQKNGSPATGRTTIRTRIYRKSDNQFFDFGDLTFKAAGHSILEAIMTEVNSVNAPGHYELPGGFNTGTITNAVANDTYITVPYQVSGNDVLPDPGEMVVGFWADALDASVSSRSEPDDVKVYESEPDLR